MSPSPPMLRRCSGCARIAKPCASDPPRMSSFGPISVVRLPKMPAFNHMAAGSIPARPTRTPLSDQELTNVATSRIADFPSPSCPVKRSGIVCTRHRPMRLVADVKLLRGLGSDVFCIRFGWVVPGGNLACTSPVALLPRPKKETADSSATG